MNVKKGLVFVVCLALSTPQSTRQAQAQLPTKEPSPSWNVVPGVLRPGSDGKYPTSVTLVLFASSCERDTTTKKWKLASDTFSLTASGSGISLSAPLVGDCMLTSTATISPGVQPDKYPIVVSSHDSTPSSSPIDQGYGDLNVLGPLSGPTPSKPEVDVEWNVLTPHTCSDTFGSHVGKIFYCVQVTIGNNSAYKLQISTIAFKTQSLFADNDEAKFNINPNTSYQTTRAVAQKGQTTTTRNLIFNSLGGVGLIMGSFTPYFHNPNSVSRWSTGAAIVSGTFTSVMDLIAPDLTIRELNNLDDQSLRDGKIISNNTQNSPFDIFVEKREVLPQLAKLYTKYKAKWNTPDIGQKEILDRLEQCVKKHGGDCDPDYVKEAMGALVLEGHKIDYIERIVVDSSVTSQEVNAPSISNGNALSVTADGNQRAVKLTGANLLSTSQITSPDTGITIDHFISNADGSLSVPVTVDRNFKGTSFKMLLQSASGNATLTVPVLPAKQVAPSALTATATNNQVSLAWAASANATSYNIYRATSSGTEGTVPYKTGVVTTTFVDAGTTHGSSYFYVVTAVGPAGESQNSSEVAATP